MKDTGSAMLPFAFILRPTFEWAPFPDVCPFRQWCDTDLHERGRGNSTKESLSAKITSAVVDYVEHSDCSKMHGTERENDVEFHFV